MPNTLPSFGTPTTLPLEYKLKEGNAGRHLDVDDVINNASLFCNVWPDESGITEQLPNFFLGEEGMTRENFPDQCLIVFKSAR